MSEQTKLTVEEAASEYTEKEYRNPTKGSVAFNAFIAGHTHALPSANLVGLDEVEQAIKDYYNGLHSWEDANPLKLITQIKQLKPVKA